MSRYIDREVAREYLHIACESIGGNGGLMLKLKFDAEPPADVRENVIAEWEVYNYDEDAYDIYGNESFAVWYRCRNCGFIHAFMDSHTEQYNFCPKCGHIIKIIRREKSNNG